jgi:hypothetical protein
MSRDLTLTKPPTKHNMSAAATSSSSSATDDAPSLRISVPADAAPAAAPLPPPLPAPRFLLLAAAVFHCLLSGSFYGYWQLVTVLQAEGGLREACDAGTPLALGCTAQGVAWGSYFTYSSVLAFGVPLLSGVLLVPRLGPRLTVLLLTGVLAAGLGLLLAATWGGGGAPGQLQSALLLPGVALIATASSANYLPLLSVASLFERSSLALSVLSGSFDAGSGVFLVLRLLHAGGGGGATLRALLAALLGGPVLCDLALGGALWREAAFAPPPSAPTSPRAVLAALAASGSVRGGSAGQALAQAEAAGAAEGPAAAAAAAAAATPAAPAAAALPRKAAPPQGAFLPALAGSRLPGLPLWRQCATAEYCGFLLYFCTLALRFNWYLASVSSQLGALGSVADVATYVNALGFLMPCCALPAVLLAGYVLDTRGPLAGLTLLSCLGTLLSVLQLLPSLPTQGLAALVFVLFRGALFSCLSVFLSHLFGFANLSALVGIITCLSGVFSLLTTPMLAWGLAGGFAAPNGLALALSAGSLLFPAWVAVRGGHASLLHALHSPRL